MGAGHGKFSARKGRPHLVCIRLRASSLKAEWEICYPQRAGGRQGVTAGGRAAPPSGNSEAGRTERGAGAKGPESSVSNVAATSQIVPSEVFAASRGRMFPFYRRGN